LRIDPWSVGGIPVASLLSLVIIGGVVFEVQRRKRKHEWAILVN
jgi:hypothetical protein